jgi:hypothetical protein
MGGLYYKDAPSFVAFLLANGYLLPILYLSYQVLGYSPSIWEIRTRELSTTLDGKKQTSCVCKYTR